MEKNNIKKRKTVKKRNLNAANNFSESDVKYFLDAIRLVRPYPKLRELRKLLSPQLDLNKINAILKYLERSKIILIDLDGNIVWIKDDNLKEESSFSDIATFSEDFLKYFDKDK